jgi:hypothetical protein
MQPLNLSLYTQAPLFVRATLRITDLIKYQIKFLHKNHVVINIYDHVTIDALSTQVG